MEHSINPFSPGAGFPPPEFVGRSDIFQQSATAVIPTELKNDPFDRADFTCPLGTAAVVMLEHHKDDVTTRAGKIVRPITDLTSTSHA